ncbi:SCO3242 family prenyltransferase [Blastococcus capsensis]|uniref:SCO3242 family prenyltransferase n=1 Tax=Blastococcus capsensis TaxID=1564163 RepID=UPI0025410B8C|nr:UbiA family prenyltransferase [Blastococcus capsensis]MDK3256794.1 UbiA family prenyltransferase [Blastococcus capsensis]
MTRWAAGPLIELVRLPAVLSIPGDVLAGAAAAGRREPRATAGTVFASASVYLAGMALNDWADRDVDARERPGRPIPSGRISPASAFGVAAGLTGAGLLAAGSAGGRDTLAVFGPLVAVAWSYDLVLKDTMAGPVAMAAARSLNVLAGAGGHGARRALADALTVGAHTGILTVVSRSEVGGASPALGRAAGAATGILAGMTAARAWRTTDAPAARAVALACVARYAVDVGGAALAATRMPSAARLQQFVARGIRAFPILDGALIAARGRIGTGLAVAALHPLAGRLGRRVATT